MAVTKIHAIKSTLKKALDYIMNPDKTDGQLLVSGLNVVPEVAYLEFKMTADVAKEVKGDYTKTGGAENVAYHMIQSFDKRDNITPEQAHQLGQQWAKAVLGDNYECVVSTHVDKGHIHNHIIFNSYSYTRYEKFRTEPFKTAQKIRELSDELCTENGLHVVEHPVGLGKKRGELEAAKRGTSWKENLRFIIDDLINEAPSFEEFISLAHAQGITVKDGKHIAFKGKEQQKFVRGNKLGAEYTKEGIMKRIDKLNGRETTEVTLTQRLVKTTPTGYVTRIPFTKEYVTYTDKEAKWINEGKTLDILISLENKYEIKDVTGLLLKTLTGAELKQYYDDITAQRTAETERTIKLSGSLENAANTPFTFDKRVMYMARKQKLKDVHRMAQMLGVIREENIKVKSDFDLRIGELKTDITRIKTELLLPLEQKNKQYQEVAKYLIAYQKYLPYREDQRKQLPHKQKWYASRYESELRAFEHAAGRLQNLGVNYDVPPEKVNDLIKKYLAEISNIEKDITSIEKQVSKIREAQDYATHILNPNTIAKEKAKHIAREEAR